MVEGRANVFARITEIRGVIELVPSLLVLWRRWCRWYALRFVPDFCPVSVATGCPRLMLNYVLSYIPWTYWLYACPHKYAMLRETEDRRVYAVGIFQSVSELLSDTATQNEPRKFNTLLNNWDGIQTRINLDLM